jgi:protein-S-isoprenylcysteine O-methyltransferase Ste14
LLGLVAISPLRAYAQAEVAPDHFDSPNTEPLPQSRQSEAAKIEKVILHEEMLLPRPKKLATRLGAAFAVLSFALVVVARIQLGSFALIPKAGELVTHGLYARLRHPMYVFVDLTICGISLAVHRWYVLLPLLILLPLQARNARAECKLLQQKFGERYDTYRANTWF